MEAEAVGGAPGDTAVDGGATAREPVHFGAALWVAPGAAYTEVAGTGVAVVPADAEVVRLTPDSAALVAALDGRPVREALADEMSRWDASQRRHIIELLRRMKSLGLVRDAPADASPQPVDWFRVVPRAASVTVAVAAGGGDTGGVDADPDIDGDAVVRLADRVGASDPGQVDEPEVHESTGARATLRAEDGALVELVLPLEAATVRFSLFDEPGRSDPDAMDSFIALVGAVDPRTQLDEPGVVDLLAQLAETVPAVWADRIWPGEP